MASLQYSPLWFRAFFFYENKYTITSPHLISPKGVRLFSQGSVLSGLQLRCLAGNRTVSHTSSLLSPSSVAYFTYVCLMGSV